MKREPDPDLEALIEDWSRHGPQPFRRVVRVQLAGFSLFWEKASPLRRCAAAALLGLIGGLGVAQFGPAGLALPVAVAAVPPTLVVVIGCVVNLLVRPTGER